MWAGFLAWNRATNWERNASIIASFAAAVGLVLSAWTIRISDEVAQDQLAHSQAQDDDQKRAQASLVNMWQTRVGDHPVFIVSSRSRDPITRLAVGLWVEGTPEEALDVPSIGVSMVEVVDSLPPCSQVTIKLNALFAMYKGKALDLGDSAYIKDVAISFFDSNAKEWERTYGGLKEINENMSNIPRKRFLAYAEKYTPNTPHENEPMYALQHPSPVTQCGGTAD